MDYEAVSTNGRTSQGVPRTLKSAYALSVSLALVMVFAIAWIFPCASHAQTSIIGQSTSTNATTEGARKSFFDSSSNIHWVFWYNGTAVEHASSPDGSTWTSRGTLAYNTPNFSVAHKVISGTSYLFFVAEANTYDVVLRRGTISGTSISFDSEVAVLDGTSSNDAYVLPVVALDLNGLVWTAAFRDLGTTNRYHLTARRTAATGDQTLTFNAAASIGKPSVSVNNVAMVPLAGEKMLAAVSGESSKNVIAYEFDGAAWSNAGRVGSGVQPVYGSVSFGTNLSSGYVDSLVVDGAGNLYAGGGFTIGGVSFAGPAKWNGSSWSRLGSGVEDVTELAVDGAGNLYAGGYFSVENGSRFNRVAKWNGTSWSPLGSGTNGTILALTVDANGILYAGGEFTTAGGVSANYIAKWNGTAWAPLDSGMNGLVYSMTVDQSGILYAGGNFTTAGGVTVNRIARWNGTSWAPLGAGFDGWVQAVTHDSAGNLYAGGYFSDAGGIAVNNIARWDGATWSALGGGVITTYGYRPVVMALSVDGSGNLYVGGFLNEAGGIWSEGLAKWNGTTWSALTVPGTTKFVYSMATHDSGRLYVGGSGFLQSWDGSAWLTPVADLFRSVSALAVDSSNRLHTGGSFMTEGGVPAQRVSTWNGTGWSALDGGLVDAPSTLTFEANGTLYGGFTSSGSSPAYVAYAASWNGTAWQQLGAGMNAQVRTAVADGGGNLYVGGDFTTVGSTAANRIAKWNGTEWSALGTGLSGIARALALDAGGNLYVAGDFTTAGGATASRIAKWNGTSWSSLGGLNAAAHALTVDATGNLYAGGTFTTAGGVTVNRIAKWNGSSWSNLGTGFTSGTVSALTFDADGNLWAGGSFIGNNDFSAPRIARWNGTAWTSNGMGFSSTVTRLSADSLGNVYAGGSFGVAQVQRVAVAGGEGGHTSLVAGQDGAAHLVCSDGYTSVAMQTYSGSPGTWSGPATVLDIDEYLNDGISSLATGIYGTNGTLATWMIFDGVVKYTEAAFPYTEWSTPVAVSSIGSPRNLNVYGSSGTHSQILATWNQAGASGWEVVSSLSGVAPTPTPTYTPTVTPTPTATPTPTPTATPTLPPPPPPDIEFGRPVDIGSGPIVVTRGRRLIVSGTGSAGYSVEIRVDGILVGTVPIPVASGGDESASRPWSYTLPDLAPGERELTTTYVRSEETKSAPSEPVKIIVVATAPLDFMGMGDTAITTWRRAGGAVRFKIRRASDEAWTTRTVRGRYPAAADYDDDGVSDVAAVGVQKGSLEWSIKLSMTGETIRATVGETGDTIISGCSFTANKGASLAVFRGKERQLRHLNVGESQPRTVTLNGLGSGNVIGCGDTDGDGVDELLFTTRGADNRIRVVGYDATGQRRFESVYNKFVRGFVVDRPNSSVPLVAVIGGTERRGRQVKITTMAGSFAFPRFFVERGATIGNGTFTVGNNQQVSGIFWANRKNRMVSRRLLARGERSTELFKLPKGYSLVRPQGVVRTEGGR